MTDQEAEANVESNVDEQLINVIKPESAGDRKDDGEPKPKRARRPPNRLVVTGERKQEVSPFKMLTKELKSWSETALKMWSEWLQWNRDGNVDEIATILGKDKADVERLMKLINDTDWHNVVLSNGFGSGILVNKDENIKTEKPLDFWYQLCNLLTPQELNNSDQLATVMKEIAENSDEEYGPIYEYLAIIMDDPPSTVHMIPKLSGLQAGILLEILHSIAISVTEAAHVNSLLRKRAIAVLKGEWETLKMPIRKDDSVTWDKRVSLQGLNPFAMPKDALPAVWNKPPPLTKETDASTSLKTGPLPSNLRSVSSMNQLKTGYKTLNLIHDTPQQIVTKQSPSFNIRYLPSQNTDHKS